MKVSEDCLLLGGQKVTILVLFMLISRTQPRHPE